MSRGNREPLVHEYDLTNSDPTVRWKTLPDVGWLLFLSVCLTSYNADWFNTNHHIACLLARDKPCSRTPNIRERKGMTSNTKKPFSLSLSLSLSPLSPSTRWQVWHIRHYVYDSQPIVHPEPVESGPLHPIVFFKINLNITIPSTFRSLKIVS